MPDELNQQDLQQLFFYQSFCATAAPLHLSPGVSINLSKVVRYEPLERTETKTIGEGKAAREIEKGTGEFDPAIVFEGGEFMILTAEQNAVFRPVWDTYSRISHQLFDAAARMFPKAEAAAVAGEEIVQ